MTQKNVVVDSPQVSVYEYIIWSGKAYRLKGQHLFFVGSFCADQPVYLIHAYSCILIFKEFTSGKFSIPVDYVCI